MESCLKLFLSVDISGSTNFKNIVNLQLLQERIKQREDLFKILKNKIKNDHRTEEDIEQIFNETLYKNISKEEADWGITIETTFNDFHTLFLRYLEKNDIPPESCMLWKALGDEIIYVHDIKNHDTLHKTVTSFSLALREYDKKLKELNILRLKGLAWTAGFPVRNRIVNFPFPVVNNDPDNLHRFPREDYLGPDMDIGFRLGKETWPGIMTISIELAQLLGDVHIKNQMEISLVGWKVLKGVWKNIPYPILWAKSSTEDLKKHSLDYKEYTTEQFHNNSYLQKLDDLKEAKKLSDYLTLITSELPLDLGIIKPYIPGKDSIHPDHLKLLEIQDKIKNSGIFGDQESLTNGCKESSLDIETEINDFFKE